MANSEIAKQKIVDALFELLKNQQLDSISVSDICHQAAISRMSYYRRFKIKTAIVDYEIDQIFTDFFNLLKQRHNPKVTDFLETFFIVCRRHKKYIKILVDAQLNDRLYQKLNYYFTDLINKGIFKFKTDMPILWVDFVSGGLNRMVMQWAHDDFKQTNQEMVMVAHRFLK